MALFKRKRRKDKVETKQLKNVQKRLSAAEVRLTALEKAVSVIQRED